MVRHELKKKIVHDGVMVRIKKGIRFVWVDARTLPPAERCQRTKGGLILPIRTVLKIGNIQPLNASYRQVLKE